MRGVSPKNAPTPCRDTETEAVTGLVTQGIPDKHDTKAEGKPQPKNHQTKRRELTTGESDFVKVLVRVLGLCIAISLAFAAGFYFAGKGNSAAWAAALTLMFAITDLEIYWVHSLGHASELSVMFEIWAVGTIVFAMVLTAGSALIKPMTVATTPTFGTAMAARPLMTFVFGGNEFASTPERINGDEPFIINGQAPFVLSTENGRLFCDVRIFSIGTNEPIIIQHNQIENLPSGWDANSNENGMEVVNAADQPVFQMYYEGPTVVRIQGIIIAAPYVYLATRDALEWIGFNSPDLPDALKAFRLPRFFKYPSAMFPGVPN